MKEFAIVISSCDSFSDLWEQHLALLKKHWKDELPKVYLITDKQTERQFENVNILFFDGDMPFRLKQAVNNIREQFILLTLDDYFLIQDVDSQRIDNLVSYMCKNEISYLSLYNRFLLKGYKYKKKQGIQKIVLNEPYAVNLYPALWDQRFLVNCINDDITPWQFEPRLTAKARELDAVCEFDQSGSFVVLDVVRKGKVLRKANKYFKRNNIDIGDRPLTKRTYELKLNTMDFIKRHSPKWFYRFLKRIGKKMGMSFYSEN